MRGGRKRLGFGFSSEDIDEAMKEVEDIEAEILHELYGVAVNYAEDMLRLEKQIVCPVCQQDKVEEQGPSIVKCRNKVKSNRNSITTTESRVVVLLNAILFQILHVHHRDSRLQSHGFHWINFCPGFIFLIKFVD